VRRFLRGALAAVLGVILVFALAALVSRRNGDPGLYPAPPGRKHVGVVVSAGTYHAGLVMPVAELAAAADKTRHGELLGIATRFSAYPYVEIGWGDEGFYRLVPTIAALTAAEALRALFRPGNPSVLHVVGLDRPPEASLAGLRLVALELSQPGFERLVSRLSESVATENGLPVELGPGLYGPSLFYRARGEFSILNVCNHFVARLLDAAGVPTTPVLDTLPLGLALDLHWRAGVGGAGEGPLDILAR
jgi:uncharacterized protein (TIGR02117 family)